jgi:cephalosporin-C deacetylase-like acetyl esterase
MREHWPKWTAFAACCGLLCAAVLAACAKDSHISLEAFYGYDRNFPLEPRVDLIEEAAGHSVYHVTYLSVHDKNVTGLLSLPRPVADPVPVILFLHGIRDTKSEDYMESGNRIFLQHGYAVFRIDAENHGERKRYDDELDLTEGYPYWTRDVIVQTVFDLRRAVDYLSTRPEIDANRIGYFGASFGGFIGVVFAGVDTRVKAPVIALAGGGLNVLFGARAVLPSVDEFLSVIEPLNFVGKIAPRPLLMINAKRDETVPPISTKWLYAHAEEPKHIIWYDTGHHEIPREQAFGEAVKWFDRHLD